ncbi:hypothetical protein MNR02_00535 [Shinella sp. H4-D48]|uniref:hypothetical protein n=1 Tax=Shinella sp. H4-D48 TaxID=2925841 RepID=UPI001F533713|nr:hypothetical protein [Shinella sp. H4-D48]UNK38234.1 hypothetical protein MNR02_00535 [Shinella sp. H4-D48]
MRLFHAAANRLKRINFDDDLSRLTNADVLLVCHDADRGLTIGGKAYSPLLDSVRERLEQAGRSSCVVAWQFSRLTGHRAHGSPHALNRSYLVATILSHLNRQLGTHADWRRPITNLHLRILDRVRPRLVISIGSTFELAMACHQKGVRHAELMHGMGYTFVPWGWDNFPTEALPTDLLTLDGKSTEVFGALVGKGVMIHQIPHPFLERFLDSVPKAMPEEWRVAVPSVSNAYAKRVLVALSWGYAGDHGTDTALAGILDNGLFPDVVRQMIEETSSSVFWCFRLHPVQLRDRNKYGQLIERLNAFCHTHENTEWNWGSQVPLPVALQNVSGVVTMSSMSCYDAAAMHVPSLALCPTLRGDGKYRDMFSDLVDEGYVTKANWSTDSFRKWLDNIPRTLKSASWQRGSRDLDSVLKELIDG